MGAILTLSPAGRRYGALRSPRDPRTLGISSMRGLLKTFTPETFPTKYSLAPFCGPVRDQGELGCCTAMAGTAMREFLLRKYQNDQTILSPLFLYYKERESDGDLSDGDTGSTGLTCVSVMNKIGVCPEPSDPYNISVFQNPPSDADVQAALKYRAGAYHGMFNVADMKSCIASDYGFVVGFTVYDSFESSEMASSGLMPVPNKTSESVLGGHEVFFMGFDDSVQCPGAKTPGAFKVQNSWGTGWGQSGFFDFSYECAADPDVLMDTFIQHLGSPWGTQHVPEALPQAT